jgi:hypothetical protein
VMTRAEVFEQIVAATGRRVRIWRLPVWLGAAQALALRAVHPRLGQLGRFAVQLARHDCVAPTYGTRRLGDYLREQNALQMR